MRNDAAAMKDQRLIRYNEELRNWTGASIAFPDMTKISQICIFKWTCS